MKKLSPVIFAITLLATYLAARQAVLPTATARPTTCTLYQLKNWTEYNKPKNGSFSDVMLWDYPNRFTGTTGVTVRLTLDQKAIAWIVQLNLNSFRHYDGWAHAPKGQIYIEIPDGQGGYLDPHIKVQWNRIASASGENDPTRNRVCVSSIVNGYGSIVGIPYQVSGDYSQFTQDWLVQKVYGEYGGVPLLFKMPLFDSTTGYHPLTKGNDGMWIPIDWFYQSDGVISIPWMITNTPTITQTLAPTLAVTVTATPTTSTPTPTVAPSSGTVVWISASPYLSVRPESSMSNVPVGFFYIGTRLQLSEIRQVGSDWWGREGNGYWIALVLNGRYYTTWRP